MKGILKERFLICEPEKENYIGILNFSMVSQCPANLACYSWIICMISFNSISSYKNQNENQYLKHSPVEMMMFKLLKEQAWGVISLEENGVISLQRHYNVQ